MAASDNFIYVLKWMMYTSYVLNCKVDLYFSKRTKPSAKSVTAQIKGVSTTKMKYKNGLGYATIVSNLHDLGKFKFKSSSFEWL